MIHNDLQTIGLTQTEATVYTWLLDFGSARPAELAAGTGLKRTTIYSAVQEMEKKGIVRMEGSNRNTTITALDPHSFQTLIEQEAKKIAEKKRATQRIIEHISQKDDQNQYLRRYQLHTIDDVTTQLTHRFADIIESQTVTQLMGWAYSDNRTAIPFITIMQDIVAAIGLETPINILAYDTDHILSNAIHEPPLHVKKWNGKELFATNTIIVGNTGFYVYRQSGIYHITEIADTIIINQMKSLWSVLWELDTPSAYREFSL